MITVKPATASVLLPGYIRVAATSLPNPGGK
jgi:hypothetical protein